MYSIKHNSHDILSYTIGTNIETMDSYMDTHGIFTHENRGHTCQTDILPHHLFLDLDYYREYLVRRFKMSSYSSWMTDNCLHEMGRTIRNAKTFRELNLIGYLMFNKN